MATLFDLSMRQLLRLQSLDPHLDDDYNEILTVIFYVLDDDSKHILLSNYLKGKGIFYNKDKGEFFHNPPESFDQIIQNNGSLDNRLISISKQLKQFLANISPPPPTI